MKSHFRDVGSDTQRAAITGENARRFYRLAARAHVGEHGRGLRGQVLSGGLRLVFLDAPEEERAVRGHLLERAGAFLLGLRDREAIARHDDHL